MKKDLGCKICGNIQFKKQGELIRHVNKIHYVIYESYILQYFFKNTYPVCNCGCGKKMKFSQNNANFFNEYRKNHWPHKKHTEKTKEKIKINYKKSLLAKYGVDNPMAIKACRQKILDTKLEKYGDAGYNNIEKNKITKLEKYGDQNYHNIEKMIETNISKYGAKTFTATKEGKEQVKKTKLERYGDEKYNNIEKNNTTKLERYGYHTEFSNPLWRKQFNGKNSKIEKLVAAEIGAEWKFIYNGKEYDMRLGSLIIEIDGEHYHPKFLSNLTLTKMANSVNDFIKMKSVTELNEYNYIKVKYEEIKNLQDITLDSLRQISYEQNFDLNYYQKILTKEYIKNYIEKKGKIGLEKYIKVFLNFIYTFQPKFPNIPTEENLYNVIEKINKTDFIKVFVDNNFRNNISNIGVSYLKSNFISYWKSSFKNKPSPYEAWNQIDIIKDIIKYRIGLNKNTEIFDFSLHQIIKGLSAARYTISFFKPVLAAAIYKHFLTDSIDPTVLDPCAGFGGRMLGFKSIYPNGTYIGIEPNIETFNELQALSKNFNNVILLNQKIEDVNIESLPKIDLTFTSIPYYDLEVYSNNTEYENYEQWKEIFLSKILSLSNLVINIPENLKNEFSYIEEYKIISNASHFSKQKQKIEYLLNISFQ